jgi:hypothetical protein
MQAEAKNVNLVDGTAVNNSIASAFGEKNVGAAFQYSWDNDPTTADYRARNAISQMRVADIFASKPETSAWTPPGGLAIYIHQGRVGGNAAENQGLVMHELLHELYGSDDGNIMEALGTAKTYGTTASIAISWWMRDNCVNGKGNN